MVHPPQRANVGYLSDRQKDPTCTRGVGAFSGLVVITMCQCSRLKPSESVQHLKP
jgi:hypothetical protein